MRRLFSIPLVHSYVDAVPSGPDSQHPNPNDEQVRRTLYETAWAMIDKGINRAGIHFPSAKVFMEGSLTPQPKAERKMPWFEAKRQAEKEYGESRQEVLAQTLYYAGVESIPFENETYLTHAYHLTNTFLALSKVSRDISPQRQQHLEGLAHIIDELNHLRDLHFAETINLNLQDGETGIVLTGGNHTIVDKLDKDIIVKDISDEARELLDRDTPHSFSDALKKDLAENRRNGRTKEAVW